MYWWIFDLYAWGFNPWIKLALWLTLPSGLGPIHCVRSTLIIHLGQSPCQEFPSSSLSITPISSIDMPIPVSSVYVGAGNESKNLRPSPWLNPFTPFFDNDTSNLLYRKYASLRPDRVNWLQPLSSAVCLLCDCLDACTCHAQVLVSELQPPACESNFPCSDLSNPLIPRNWYPKEENEIDDPLCEEIELSLQEDEDVPFDNSNETLRGFGISPGYSGKFDKLIASVRNARCRVFWEIFSGCAILTQCFRVRGWECGTPVDIADNPDFNVLNPVFFAVLIGLILEGRVALLHVGPPCSSLSWAVNRWPRYAMRSVYRPEGVRDSPSHRLQ